MRIPLKRFGASIASSLPTMTKDNPHPALHLRVRIFVPVVHALAAGLTTLPFREVANS